MELKFKRLSEKAILPIRAHKSDAGLDLTCTRITTGINDCGQLMLVYHTDLAVEIPDGYVGLLFPRSSIYKKSLTLTNSVGVIDSGYRGEIQAVFKTTTDVIPAVYKEGERFCQLVIVPIAQPDVVEAAELSESDRGEEGFGSTDSETKYSAPSEDQSSATVDAKDSTEDMSADQHPKVAAGDTSAPEQAE